MLPTNEALMDSRSLELCDLLSSDSFPPKHYPTWLYLSSLVFLLLKSLSPSCYYDKVPCSVADLVANIVLVKVLGSLPLSLSLPFVCVVCR